MTKFSKNLARGATAVALCLSISAMSVSSASAQVPQLGALFGGAAGAALGSRGGAGGAIAGAIIGVTAGMILQGMIDEIEKNNARQLANSAVRTGNGGSKTFKNSKGQTEKVATKVHTIKNAEGRSCRQVTTSVERDGQASSGGGTQTVCQVQVASGKLAYQTIE
jgi:hypothetical protein